MQRIVPNVWCRRTAGAAGAFYASVFPDTTARVTSRYPEEGLLEFQRPFAGQELVVDVSLGGYLLRLINAGDEFAPTPAISFLVAVDPRRFGGEAGARDAIDRMWRMLADGGEVRMPLAAYPHSPHYGWVADRYGVNWQLMLTSADGPDLPFVTPQLLFTGAQPHARDAMQTYTALFDDSAVVMIAPRPPAGPADAESVLFGAFTLAGQAFSAMDGGTAHEFTFTPGISLQVACDDQVEIDRLWGALSAVPEAEQCGWLVDRFGVSWQIIPARMDDLLAAPGAFERMLAMTKLDIAGLRAGAQ